MYTAVVTNSTNPPRPYFARHETFHPRYGWLKKAVDRVSEDANVFTREDAPVVLGVGKNMVSAIRYWAQAFKLIEAAQGDENSGYQASELGQNLLQDKDAWDPYLEDLGSLWLLHWHLLKPQCLATAWHFMFNEFNHISFNVDDALYGLNAYKDSYFPSAKTAESSLKKDILCILRMFTASDGEKKQAKEDSIASPFQELGLIQHIRGPYYQFNVGAKPSLPPEIIAFACADFASQRAEARTVNISSLLYDEGSPGLIFKLNEVSLRDALEQVMQHNMGLYVSESAGLMQLAFSDSPAKLANNILGSYFSS
ncbi:MAG: DUF4007 family protein [Candidatus Sericytochromatia bacterium]|nr:DUF4007 family protein [Candidatus Sericytochromatia bacterium]